MLSRLQQGWLRGCCSPCALQPWPIAPGPTTAFFGYIVHLDVSGMRRELTVASFIVGLTAWTLGTALTFGFAAMIYNRLIGPAAVEQAAAPAHVAVQRT